MPVVGHAFVGLATAMQFGPAPVRDAGEPTATVSGWWAPAVVVASYFPDIITQIGGAFGLPQANAYGHSLGMAALGGLALGGVWSSAAGTPLVRAVVIASGSILGHDLLDLIQAADWPWPGRFVETRFYGLSGRIVSEAIWSALLFAVFLAWRVGTGRSRTPAAPKTFTTFALTRLMPSAIVTLILLAAVGTYVLRGRHERQLNTARVLIDRGSYVEALEMAERADAWPRGNRPGRIDMLRGEAHQRLGHSEIAETLFLRAYEQDPENFWALADLAEHYALSARPEQRSLARVRADELRRRFPRHPRLQSVLDGIERELSRGDAIE